MILLHHHLSFPLILLLPHWRFIDGQRLLSDPVRLSLSVDLTAPILTSYTHLLQVHLQILHNILLLVHLQIHYQTHHQFILRDVIHQRAAPLSTPYPPTTSKPSLDSSSERSLDSSSPSSKPSRKRCRSPTALVPSSTHVLRLIAPTPADLLPPCKRFRDSYLREV
ncbi:hypothetical protein Tco_1039105 [Tanacetum coccineum]